ncbi:hypothetical protein SLS62_000257 [Diatrype stigma]|uniref:Uncharacterized protein n=1 Tax=Diatrype stigma TaxID=117547 RepID=A0AAN9YXA9_9PEZI
MLEKTAASLEPCGLQRVLPSANKSFRSRRQLHTTFWQHGAAGIELGSAWQALMHGTSDSSTMDSHSGAEGSRGPALTASTFLLDFLYPTGALALMRRPNPGPSDRLDKIRPSGGLRSFAPRSYTSSTSKSDSTTKPAQDGNELEDPEKPGDPEKPEDPEKPREQSDPTVQTTEEALEDLQGGKPQGQPDTTIQATERDLEDVQSENPAGLDGANPTDDAADHASALDELLVRDDPETSDQVWHHYQALEPESQDRYVSRVLLFLSRTGRLADSWKVSELFRKLDVARWDSQSFAAGVKADINLQNNNEALETLVRGLDHEAIELESLVEALDLVLAQALRSDTPDLLCDLWKHFPKMAARWDFDSITSELKHVVSVPRLADKALNFRRISSEILQNSAVEISQDGLQALQKILVRRALISCSDFQVKPLLKITKDPLAYEEYLRGVIVPGRRHERIIEVYNIYRQLPGAQPTRNVLHEVFKTYKTMDVHISKKLAGLELLWGDFHTFHTNPSLRAYQRYLAFYASLGDKKKVHTLWRESIDLFIEDLPRRDDVFTHLQQVHAVLGEVEEVQKIFDSITTLFHQTPNIYCWNILLNAYAKAGDYDGAIQVFEKLCAVGEPKPDKYSYGTLMQMAGSRGDLGFTVDLYGRARRSGILANDAILGSLIDAYCQNDLMKEAQDVCMRAARQGMLVPRLWNRLLHYYALRRDLVNINKVLNTMAEKQVPYNSFTYEQLLMGLALCRQSQHALHLLAVGINDKIFEVTTRHFYIVMGALLKTGEPEPVLSLHRMMKQNGVPTSYGIVFRLIQALGQYKTFSIRERTNKASMHFLGGILRSFYDIYGYKSMEDSDRRSHHNELLPKEHQLLTGGPEPFQFSTMMYMFVELKEFVRAKELVHLYRYVFQDQEDSILPAAMLNSVMLADLRQEQYERVQKTWHVLFRTAKKVALSEDYVEDLPHTSKISPKYRYVLSGGIKIMQEMLFIQRDATGLQDLVREVREAGFELDSKNWNLFVQYMVQLKQYEEAFSVCEEYLMPNWSGWFTARVRENVKNSLPLDLRRKGSSAQYLRPTATTLYRLAQGYMELDQMSPWSPEAGGLLRQLVEDYPQVVRAIKSMIRVYSDLEYKIFEEEPSSPYSLDEQEMEDALDLESGDDAYEKLQSTYDEKQSADEEQESAV